ncbi:MAG: beta-phosphoglucomutase [Cellulomonadaceae bacterium]|nr:beta-phosphoglucomutase [Cellulomonadaceae bacterium]
MNSIEAVIFDLDGVLTDTAEIHYQAWQRLADELGIPFDRAYNENFRGVGRDDCLRLLLDRQAASTPVTDEEFTELATRKNNYYREALSQLSEKDILPGVTSLLGDLRTAGIKTAVGSASKNTMAILDRIGLVDAFDAIVDGTMTSRSKPDPEVFLLAAQKLGVEPGLCLVMEDAAAGVDAGLAAGEWVLGIGPVSRVGHAHAVAPNLEGLGWDAVLRLLDDGAWTVRRVAPNRPDHHLETLFSVGNGHIAVRGTALEGQVGEDAASFMHAIWDDKPQTRTELANLPSWWGMDVWINGQRMGVSDAQVVTEVNMRNGVLRRTFTYTPDAETEIQWTDERFCNMADQLAAGSRLTLTAVRGTADVRLRAGINAHVDNLGLLHWDVKSEQASETHAALHVRTRATDTDVAIVSALTVDAPSGVDRAVCDANGQPASEARIVLSEGDTVSAVKSVGFATSALSGAEASGSVSDDDAAAATYVDAATARADRWSAAGWDEAVAANTAAWQTIWEATDVTIDGDPQAQVALRYNLFQLLVAAPRVADASIGAKTLTGYGYNHHVFWDTEIFMLPPFSYTDADVARRMLDYRWNRLEAARQNSSTTGSRGARFPWESAGTGEEVCPVWLPHPTDAHELVRIWCGDLELHINADVAYAIHQYWDVTGDDQWMRTRGAEMFLDIATFWATKATLEADGFYHLLNVVGPDEYHDGIDDNAYTNQMAVWNLLEAARILAWLDATYPEDAARVRQDAGIDAEVEALWATVADGMVPPVFRDGVMEQFTGYFDLEDVNQDVIRDPKRTVSMQFIHGIEGVAETQNIKQPDVLMLAFLRPELFTAEQFAATYRYYDDRTDHEMGSSLGPSFSAIIAARAGDPERAYDHFMRAALADLYDVRGNASDGIHGASTGGLWQAVVLGFAGLTVDEDGAVTHADLPHGWTQVTFPVVIRGERQVLTVTR